MGVPGDDDGVDVQLIFTLQDYLNIENSQSFNILIKECHVLKFIPNDITPILYNIYQATKEFDIAAGFFTLEPACVYDKSYTLDVKPAVSDRFYSQQVEFSSKWQLVSGDTDLEDIYDFTVTVTLVGYPPDNPFNDGTGINISGENDVEFKVQLTDLCPNSDHNDLIFDVKDSDTDLNYDYEFPPVF